MNIISSNIERLRLIHVVNNPALKWSHDRVVSFDPVTHTYMREGELLQGVTTYIEQYKNKFDADAMAVTYAAKHGLDPVAVLAEWKKKGDDSRDSGHDVHEVFEHYSNTYISRAVLKGEIRTKNIWPKEQVAVKFINDYFETGRLIPVIAESIVYSSTLASMRDQIAKNDKGEYFILDWKTNSEIKKDSWGKWMKPPYQYLPDASFYHYSLQLRIYQAMSKDYKIRDCYIVHIGETDYTFYKAKDIQVPKEILT